MGLGWEEAMLVERFVPADIKDCQLQAQLHKVHVSTSYAVKTARPLLVQLQF